MKRSITFSSLTGILITLSGCGILTTGTIPAPANTPDYQAGYQDGCTTAHGDYTKNSELFKKNRDYYDGWFAGRSGCQGK